MGARTTPYSPHEPLGHLSPDEQQIAPPRWATVQISVGDLHSTIEVECYRGHVLYEGMAITWFFTPAQLAKLSAS